MQNPQSNTNLYESTTALKQNNLADNLRPRKTILEKKESQQILKSLVDSPVASDHELSDIDSARNQ